jgi:hypothetical protein
MLLLGYDTWTWFSCVGTSHCMHMSLSFPSLLLPMTPPTVRLACTPPTR